MLKRLTIPTIFLLSVALALPACETAGGSAATGALVGAGVGAAIGSASGNAGEGALIGAAVGGLGGLIVHDVRARRAKSAEETVQTYNYEPTQGTVLTFEHAEVQPQVVNRGNLADASIQYALLGAGAGTEVTETRVLRRGSQIVAQLSERTFSRNDGTWVSSQQFKIAEQMDPGQYTVVQTVHAGGSTISGTTNFIVQ